MTVNYHVSESPSKKRLSFSFYDITDEDDLDDIIRKVKEIHSKEFCR
jgi:hypothetical protein